MSDSNIINLIQPKELGQDPLTDLIRRGTRDLIVQAVDFELQLLLEQYAGHKLPDGRQAVIRNGYLPERTVQTGLGDVEVNIPKVRVNGV